jgi:hypothetical protein
MARLYESILTAFQLLITASVSALVYFHCTFFETMWRGRSHEGDQRDNSADRHGAVRDRGLCADRNGDSRCGLKDAASGRLWLQPFSPPDVARSKPHLSARGTRSAEESAMLNLSNWLHLVRVTIFVLIAGASTAKAQAIEMRCDVFQRDILGNWTRAGRKKSGALLAARAFR